MPAAVTGHLVLSTIHTTDAPGAITRLLHMGVPPYLVAGGLTGVIAQRLVRTVCVSCRRSGGKHCRLCLDGYQAGPVSSKYSPSTTTYMTRSFTVPRRLHRAGWLPKAA